jgi:hypothetical protein
MKKQVITCPICQEDKKAHELSRSATCSHSVCWKCYGLAFQAGHPIEKCPLCRAVFTERKNPNSYADSSDGSDYDTDDLENEFDEFDEDLSQDLIEILEQTSPDDTLHTVMGRGTGIASAINNTLISQEEISLILAASVDSDDERQLRQQIEMNLSNGVLSV